MQYVKSERPWRKVPNNINFFMEKKYVLLGGGILGLIALVLVLVVALLVAFFFFGVSIPGLDSLLEVGKTDLDVEYDPVLFSMMLEEEGVVLASNPSNYCLTCDIIYSDPGPMDISVTSEELTSYLQATNNEKGPLKNIQVKLGSDNRAEVAADVDLTEYGYNLSGPVYAVGRIETASDKSVRITLAEVSSGPLPVPGDQVQQGEDALEDLINEHLSEMEGLRIDSLKIEDGELHFEGMFPKTISA